MDLLNRKEKLKTILDPEQLRFGDTINSSIKDVEFWDIPTHLIRLYQRIHFYSHWKDSHTVTFVGEAHGRFDTPHIFEATIPYARYIPFSEWYSPEDHIYNTNRYKDAKLSFGGEAIMLAIFNTVDGTIYDVGSLIDFLIQDILGYPLTYWGKWLDFGEDNMVCSVVARTAQMKWYDTELKDLPNCRRPGGSLHVERTPPALFPDNDTYFHL